MGEEPCFSCSIDVCHKGHGCAEIDLDYHIKKKKNYYKNDIQTTVCRNKTYQKISLAPYSYQNDNAFYSQIKDGQKMAASSFYF